MTKKLRQIAFGDIPELYELFSRAQIKRENSEGRTNGFYEYNLSFDSFRDRVKISNQDGFGLVLKEGERIRAYLLAYRPSQAREISDEVLRQVEVPSDTVYVDQLCVSPGVQLHQVGRMVDAWNEFLHPRNIIQIFSAVPWKPWRNFASTRLNIARGYKKQGVVSGQGWDLAIFGKPVWRVGRPLGEFQIQFEEGVKND
ncbi:MAG: hypothetical protein DDT42_01627 [candidate division WS2 bacterium]|uniref:Uncharacterized protein n=1 Tax=Psychracetigena formicireducens TaxID=2986056 RepID=A0A9E2BJR5_PSYF1|nr:hypothetical protein [Candidatus Psychracetigena formicireducens]